MSGVDVCPACHHPEHDPGACREGCSRCELHFDEAIEWLQRHGMLLQPQDRHPHTCAYCRWEGCSDEQFATHMADDHPGLAFERLITQ